MAIKIGVISLGCPKNLVDTEVLLGELSNEDYVFVQSLDDADIALINTCGFITEAKEESIEAILEAEQQKRFGNLQGIIVTGCLSERYREELKKLLPRVDVFLGVRAHEDIIQAVEHIIDGKKLFKFDTPSSPANYKNRVISSPPPTAYVKIADGCSNLCAYCAIPSIKGPYVSRSMEDLLEEIELLSKRGYSEIILVAQDTTKYGEDIYGEPKLYELLDRAADIDGVKWLRSLYFYPDEKYIDDRLLSVMAKHGNILKYIDMPVQHMDNGILASMNRINTGESVLRLVSKIRSVSDDFIIRSTVMVGYPGESYKNFENLLDGVKEASFDRLGVFSYSDEDGTPAAELPNRIDDDEKEFRKHAVMDLQAQISHRLNARTEGRVLDVLIEGEDPQSGMYFGRTYAQIPDVDGKTFVRSNDTLETGRFYKTLIKRAYNYDIEGDYIGEPDL